MFHLVMISKGIDLKGTKTQFERHVEAVLAAVDILDCFLEVPRLTVKELVEMTGFTRNRVERLLGTLISRDLLYPDHDGVYFLPGARLLALGKVFERENTLVSLGHSALRELVRLTGESSSIYIRQGYKQLILAREDGTHPLRIATIEGELYDLHIGAGGKLLLAHAPQEIQSHILNKNILPYYTSATFTDPDQLARELEQIRKQGYAVSLGERVDDAAAIAAPVFNIENQMIAAIGVIGPKTRFKEYPNTGYLGHVTAIAEQLSRRFGYRGTRSR